MKFPFQMVFSRVEAPSTPPRKVLILLLMSMVNEKQPFSLRFDPFPSFNFLMM